MSCYSAFENIKHHYGIKYELRKEQATVMELLVARQNVLAILPTGFGKSTIYALLPSILKQVC